MSEEAWRDELGGGQRDDVQDELEDLCDLIKKAVYHKVPFDPGDPDPVVARFVFEPLLKKLRQLRRNMRAIEYVQYVIEGVPDEMNPMDEQYQAAARATVVAVTMLWKAVVDLDDPVVAPIVD